MILAGKYTVVVDEYLPLALYVAVGDHALALYAAVCRGSVMSAVLTVNVPLATTL